MEQGRNKFFGIVSLLFFLLTIVGCSNNMQKNEHATTDKQDSWSKIEKKKKIVIGIDQTFVPLGFKDKKNKLTGFDIELARAVFKQYDIEPIFQNIDWSMKENELNNGSIDLIWNGYAVNAQREKKVMMSKPYLADKQVLLTMKKNNIKKAKDMSGKVIGGQTGSSGMDAYDNYSDKLKKYIPEEPQLFETFNEGLIDLESGRIDGLIINEIYARYYTAKKPDSKIYRIIDSGFPEDKIAVGMHKNDKNLQKKINQAFEKLAKNGELSKLSKKWFDKNITLIKG